MSERWHAILNPSERAGAIAMILLRHDDPSSIGLPNLNKDQIRRSDLLGIDDGLAMGVDAQTMLLMPHGGVAITRALSLRLTESGVPVRQELDPVEVYPEAQTEIEAWCLHGLSRSMSPMAIDLLLEHNARWASLEARTFADASNHPEHPFQSELDRVLHPPTIAAVGRANIGKSSLLNALVGQRVSLVADSAGTTRDHVGAPVDLGGLVVRWVDMPGIDERIADRAEFGIARETLQDADLILHCIDSGTADAELDPRIADAIRPSTPVLRVGTRSDLGAHLVPVDVRVSLGAQSEGLKVMVTLLRDRLVPHEARSHPSAWRFWASLRGSA